MITIRDATPEERALILRDTCAPVGEIPPARHLTPARVAELCGMPREEFLRGPVLAAPVDGSLMPRCASAGHRKTIVWSALGDLVRSRAVRKIRLPEGNRFRLMEGAP